jgi:release factor glutamine methyltransferase
LVLEREDLRVLATDFSSKALNLAKKNALKLRADMERLHFVEGSFWEPVGGEPFEALVANPPYVDPGRPELLSPEVREFEPHEALFGPGGNPLGAYRELLMGGVKGLVSGALVLFEVGVDTAERVLDLIQRSRSYHQGNLFPDLAGHPRLLTARRK